MADQGASSCTRHSMPSHLHPHPPRLPIGALLMQTTDRKVESCSDVAFLRCVFHTPIRTLCSSCSWRQCFASVISTHKITSTSCRPSPCTPTFRCWRATCPRWCAPCCALLVIDSRSFVTWRVPSGCCCRKFVRALKAPCQGSTRMAVRRRRRGGFTPSGPPPPPRPAWEPTKFTIGKILSGHFWYADFWVPDPTSNPSPAPAHDVRDACVLTLRQDDRAPCAAVALGAPSVV